MVDKIKHLYLLYWHFPQNQCINTKKVIQKIKAEKNISYSEVRQTYFNSVEA